MSILTLRDIIYSYADGTSNVLNGINYQFEKGKFYAIVGSSGAGKSTLLGLLAGLDTPTGGQILFDDEDIAEQGYSHHRKHNISLVFQNYNLIDYLTPLENLKLVNPKATNETLHTMGLDDDHINRNVRKLSGGQQQRVAIGRALVSPRRSSWQTSRLATWTKLPLLTSSISCARPPMKMTNASSSSLTASSWLSRRMWC